MSIVLGLTMAGSTFMDAHHDKIAGAKATDLASGYSMLASCTALCALILVPSALGALYAWRIVKPPR